MRKVAKLIKAAKKNGKKKTKLQKQADNSRAEAEHFYKG